MHIILAIVTMVTVNVGGETYIPVNLTHGRTKAKLLMGLESQKYIELPEN